MCSFYPLSHQLKLRPTGAAAAYMGHASVPAQHLSVQMFSVQKVRLTIYHIIHHVFCFTLPYKMTYCKSVLYVGGFSKVVLWFTLRLIRLVQDKYNECKAESLQKIQIIIVNKIYLVFIWGSMSHCQAELFLSVKWFLSFSQCQAVDLTCWSGNISWIKTLEWQ